MNDALTNADRITSGPEEVALEQEFKELSTVGSVICVNLPVPGAMLMMHRFSFLILRTD